MERFVRYVLTALICCVAIGQFVQVITRYVFQVPIMGLEETILYPTIWLYMLGGVSASRDNSHIRANVLEIFLKTPRQHAALAIIGEIVSLIIGFWLLYWAWDYTQYAWRVWRESATLYIPTFYSDIALFSCLALMMLYTILHLLGLIKTLRNGVAP